MVKLPENRERVDQAVVVMCVHDEIIERLEFGRSHSDATFVEVRLCFVKRHQHVDAHSLDVHICLKKVSRFVKVSRPKLPKELFVKV